MQTYPFIIYLAVMAGVTYLIRMLPLVLIKRKIQNRFLLSFLYYIPYAVLTVMTIPACFSATSDIPSAIVGFVVALILAFFEKSLLTASIAACSSALLVNLITTYII